MIRWGLRGKRLVVKGLCSFAIITSLSRDDGWIELEMGGFESN
jgi:hypothetical protein